MRSDIVLASIVAVVASGMSRPIPVRAATAPDACALLTPAQVSAALGVTVGAGTPTVPGHPEMCTWALASDPTHTGTHASIDITLALGSRTPRQRFETGKTPVPGIPKTPAPGIGDDAYYTKLTHAITLSVRKGEVALQVRVMGVPDADMEAKEKALAIAALAKL
jgi:hypothetical protein